MFAVGDVLNQTYRIEKLLGRGGMACVYVVSHARLPNRRFALKVITAPAAQGGDFLARFRREAEILASLDHPNLVNVIDWNQTPEGQPYLVMELLSGEDLADCLRRVGALPPSIALDIFRQVSEALGLAHSHGIVHRDLKPANLFLCKNGPVPHFVKVLDFGIAKSGKPGSAQLTEQIVLMGTPAYMSPEQARGNIAQVDARSDQFSLALVLYEMLAGQPAFYRRGEPPMMTLARILTEEAPPLRDPQLDRAIQRALAKDPVQRYASLAEFVEAVFSSTPAALDLIERTDRVQSVIVPLGEAQGAGPGATSPPSAGEPPEPPESEPGAAASKPPSRGRLSLGSKTGGELVAYRRRRPLWGGAIVGGCLLLALGLALRQPATGATDPPRPAAPDAAVTELPDAGAAPDLLVLVDLAAPADLSPPVVEPLAPLGGSLPGPRKPPPPPLIHRRSEVQIVGVPMGSAASRFALRCFNTSFGRQRPRIGTVIELRRTGTLRVISKLPPELARQLETCLAGIFETGQSPTKLDIKIVEGK